MRLDTHQAQVIAEIYNKMWKSNVKSVKVKTANGGAQKMYVCTSCLRSGKVERA